eukprot:scaffold129196_cov19-Tisochrysis_lutea.AAC.1
MHVKDIVCPAPPRPSSAGAMCSSPVVVCSTFHSECAARSRSLHARPIGCSGVPAMFPVEVDGLAKTQLQAHLSHSMFPVFQMPAMSPMEVKELVKMQLQTRKPIRAPWYRGAGNVTPAPEGPQPGGGQIKPPEKWEQFLAAIQTPGPMLRHPRQAPAFTSLQHSLRSWAQTEQRARARPPSSCSLRSWNMLGKLSVGHNLSVARSVGTPGQPMLTGACATVSHLGFQQSHCCFRQADKRTCGRTLHTVRTPRGRAAMLELRARLMPTRLGGRQPACYEVGAVHQLVDTFVFVERHVARCWGHRGQNVYRSNNRLSVSTTSCWPKPVGGAYASPCRAMRLPESKCWLAGRDMELQQQRQQQLCPLGGMCMPQFHLP